MMERLTERNKHGVAVVRQDLPRGPENNLVTRLAAYEDSGIDPKMVAVIGWDCSGECARKAAGERRRMLYAAES